MTAGASAEPPEGFDVALAFTRDGAVYDYIGNWETAQTMANEGYKIRILKGDGGYSREELQAMVDRELAAAVDCFGEDHLK